MRCVDRAAACASRLLLAAACTAWSAAGNADVLIVSSDVAALKAGQQVADAERIEVPAGAKVRVLLPSGKTQLINGPASGSVKDIAKGGPVVEGVWAKAKDLIATGGADASRPGATRGAAASAGTSVFGWDVVPTAINGSVCVESGLQLKLARSSGDGAAQATLLDTTSNAKAPFAWAAQSALADWPAALPPKADAVYHVVTPSARPVVITLRMVEKSETGDDSALATLLQNGCRAQARVWLTR